MLGREGVVPIEAIIGTDGTVTSVRVGRSTPGDVSRLSSGGGQRRSDRVVHHPGVLCCRQMTVGDGDELDGLSLGRERAHRIAS